MSQHCHSHARSSNTAVEDEGSSSNREAAHGMVEMIVFGGSCSPSALHTVGSHCYLTSSLSLSLSLSFCRSVCLSLSICLGPRDLEISQLSQSFSVCFLRRRPSFLRPISCAKCVSGFHSSLKKKKNTHGTQPTCVNHVQTNQPTHII